jgi:uncharacterized protein YcbX
VQTAGQLTEIWVYPVKSLRGHQLNAAAVERGGVTGDRAWVVADALDGTPVTARHAPTLREVTARLECTPFGGTQTDADVASQQSDVRPGAPPDVRLDVRLEVPGAQPGLAGADAEAALSRHLGRSVVLQRAGDGSASFVDVAPVHIVSRAAIATAVEHGAECDACDVADPRANLVVVLDAGAGSDRERDWVGCDLMVGAALLRVSRTPQHCLGVYADVLMPGRLEVGSVVALGTPRRENGEEGGGAGR